MKRLIVFLTLVVCAAGAAPARGQTQQTGTLRIVVKDPSGAVIPNATVIVKGTDAANRDVLIPEAVSDGQGVATATGVVEPVTRQG